MVHVCVGGDESWVVLVIDSGQSEGGVVGSGVLERRWSGGKWSAGVVVVRRRAHVHAPLVDAGDRCA